MDAAIQSQVANKVQDLLRAACRTIESTTAFIIAQSEGEIVEVNGLIDRTNLLKRNR